MKNFILILGIFFSCMVGIALASSVTTKDGKIFMVTNDGGTTWPMTNRQIMAQVATYNIAMTKDYSQFGLDQEQFLVWNGVEGMAQQASANLTTTTMTQGGVVTP